jgi:hypothetical protein
LVARDGLLQHFVAQILGDGEHRMTGNPFQHR